MANNQSNHIDMPPILFLRTSGQKIYLREALKNIVWNFFFTSSAQTLVKKQSLILFLMLP